MRNDKDGCTKNLLMEGSITENLEFESVEWFAAYRRGDPQAFSQYFLCNYDRIFGYVRSWMNDAGNDAKIVAANALFVLWPLRDRMDQIGELDKASGRYWLRYCKFLKDSPLGQRRTAMINEEFLGGLSREIVKKLLERIDIDLFD